MCGLLGEFGESLTEREAFMKLLQLSRQRGPDMVGYWSDEINGQLGFNRLSILDTSERGTQPMVSPSGRFIMVFNGEIYNYKDLLRKYSLHTERLRSTSDSEVLIQILEMNNIEQIVQELNGMFAIGIFDKQERRVHLVRDFAGIKPLFYGVKGNILTFASQFDQIFKHPSFKEKRELIPESIKEYFGLGYMPAPNTVFRNMYQVEPGELITWGLREAKIIRKVRFYDWKVFDKERETSAKTLECFEGTFTNVIKDQLNADVPVATFLSGGIDSPLVTAFSAKCRTDIKAFTIGVDNPFMDETEIASKYASSLGVHHVTEKFTERQLLEVVQDHFKVMTEPLGDYSSLPTYLVTKRARQFATVMLSGDGGDELFWGYPRFLTQANNAKYFELPLGLRRPLAGLARKLFRRPLSYALDSSENFSDWTFNFHIQFFKEDLERMVLNTSYSKQIMDLYNYRGSLKDKTSILRWLKWNEFFGHLQRVLRKVDLASMGNSLEVRVPFLDKRSIELSNSFTPELGSSHHELKYILRRALVNKVPSCLIAAEKRGFGIPIDRFLRHDLKNEVIQTCCSGVFFGEQFLDVKLIRQNIADFMEGKHNNSWGIWHIYAWQKWAQVHVG
jgi:asparagine synthase (glutamine-hydrolysing)